MNYISMVEALKEGKKAARSSWEAGMCVWYGLDMLLHSHPYWPDQQSLHIDSQASTTCFPYICEKDDATTNDWHLVAS